MLEQILEEKRAEVAKLNPAMVRNVRPSTRDIGYAIGTGREAMSLFVELKRQDPFAGKSNPELDLVGTALRLQEVGVGAFLVATESTHWGGSRNDLIELDKNVAAPLVRNDFIIDELQLYESRRAGADAVLLRPALVAPDVLRGFIRMLASMHMGSPVLVHSRKELESALAADAQIICISNRDFQSGDVDLGTTLELAPLVPKTRSVISCFGIQSRDDVARLRGHVDGICLGSSLLRAPDPIEFLKGLG